MSTTFSYKREAVRIKVMKFDPNSSPEHKKFTVDPQLTSYEVLRSFLAKAFDIKVHFTVCYKIWDDYGQETYIALLSDWDLDAAFLSASEPYLSLRVDLKPHEEVVHVEEETIASVETKAIQGLPGFIINHVGKTFNSMLQRALNLTEEAQPALSIPPRPPLSDTEFRSLLKPNGQLSDSAALRSAIYYGGVEPSLRKVVWKHLLNVYPEGLSGKERIDYIKKKSLEYINLRDTWRELLKNGQMVGDLGYVTSMVRKDVLRTDRHHSFYAGSDDNKNIASLFNILTTYAMNHPSVSYCQGMSDLASPLLVTMNDEAHAYICFCSLMVRLSPNFLLDGITMTQRFQHLADGLHYYDFPFYTYLKSHQADDLLFCYRWLLLEMKREFAFEDALRMLEVMWSSLPPTPPSEELPLYQTQFVATLQVPSPRPKENAYTKVCALRRGLNAVSLDERGKGSLVKCKPFVSLDDAALREPRRIRNLNEFMTFDKKRQNRTPDSSPDDDTNEYQPMNTSFTQELRLDLESLERHVFGGECDGCYVWENPLERSPDPLEEMGNIADSDLMLRRRKQSVEPPKSPSLDSNIPDIRNGTNSTDRSETSSTKKNNTSDCYNASTAKTNSSEQSPQSGVSSLPNEHQHEPSDTLPPPHIFGSGNPFLMFLCLTVLTQYRDHIVSQRMDYNEIAMHFDKMVRKHDVTRVLNQARDMFASYLKQHSVNHFKV